MRRSSLKPSTKPMKRSSFTPAGHRADLKAGKKRLRKCKVCRTPFEPGPGLVNWCSIEHGVILAEQRLAKKKAADVRQAAAQVRREKQDAKPLSWYLDATQADMNAYVRLVRDVDEPCISCGRPASWAGQWHASHYKSRGSNSALRFNLWNLHKACSICNNHLSVLTFTEN